MDWTPMQTIFARISTALVVVLARHIVQPPVTPHDAPTSCQEIMGAV
jgi:hypothetical protein